MIIEGNNLLLDPHNPYDNKIFAKFEKWAHSYKRCEPKNNGFIIFLKEKQRIRYDYISHNNQLAFTFMFRGKRAKLLLQRKLCTILETTSIPEVLEY